MGFPAQGVEGYFRNNILDIARYLNERHKDHFMVFNLSAERSYDPELMQRRVIQMGFPDHHAPPLTLLFRILLRVHAYLQEDEDNVACIHCLAGRGRTGCIIVSYLVFSTMLPSVLEAFDFYAQRRSNRLQGVSQPSQRRYCTYVDEIIRRKNEDISAFNPRPRALLLTRIRFGPVPSVSSQGGLRPLLYIYNYTHAGEEVLHVTETERDRAKHFVGGAKTVVLDVTEKTSKPVLLLGDIAFKMSHISTLLGVTKYDEVVRLIFHTGMEAQRQIEASRNFTLEQRTKLKLNPDEHVLIFRKPDLDVAYKDNRFLDSFRIEFVYKVMPDIPEASKSDINLWDEELYQNFTVTNRSIELEKKLDMERKSAKSRLGLASSSEVPRPTSPLPPSSQSSTNPTQSHISAINTNIYSPSRPPSQTPPMGHFQSESMQNLSNVYHSNYIGTNSLAQSSHISNPSSSSMSLSASSIALSSSPSDRDTSLLSSWEVVSNDSKPQHSLQSPLSHSSSVLHSPSSAQATVNNGANARSAPSSSSSISQGWVAVVATPSARTRSTAFAVNLGQASRKVDPALTQQQPLVSADPSLNTPNISLSASSSTVPNPSTQLHSSPPLSPHVGSQPVSLPKSGSQSPSSQGSNPGTPTGQSQVISPWQPRPSSSPPIDPLEMMRY